MWLWTIPGYAILKVRSSHDLTEMINMISAQACCNNFFIRILQVSLCPFVADTVGCRAVYPGGVGTGEAASDAGGVSNGGQSVSDFPGPTERGTAESATAQDEKDALFKRHAGVI